MNAAATTSTTTTTRRIMGRRERRESLAGILYACADLLSFSEDSDSPDAKFIRVHRRRNLAVGYDLDARHVDMVLSLIYEALASPGKPDPDIEITDPDGEQLTAAVAEGEEGAAAIDSNGSVAAVKEPLWLWYEDRCAARVRGPVRLRVLPSS